jgi:hypothetical protein
MEYTKKTTDQSHIIDKLYHIMLYWIHLDMSGIPTHNTAMILLIQKLHKEELHQDRRTLFIYVVEIIL